MSCMTSPEAYSAWVNPEAEARGTVAAAAMTDHFILTTDAASCRLADDPVTWVWDVELYIP